MAGFFSKERTVAGAGFNRWLVPPAALAIHLSIGMAYGFSVFWLPLSKALGIKEPIACAETMGIWARAFATDCDWKVSDLGWMYTLFFVFLGSSAAVFGHWLEHAGPRKAGAVAAICWGGGLLISAYGVYSHQLWMMWLGSGVIGGIGLGLGYISPVSTLIKWFPDRRGMATGMAIMGFGGGAMIGAPLANSLMAHFATPDSVGVWQTFAIMGGVYFVTMMIGALSYRVPANGWKPAGWEPPASSTSAMITNRHVHVNHAHKTPQFWLLWAVLCLNVSAGIGVIGMASPMLQEVFGGALIGEQLKLGELSTEQLLQVTAIGAGFAGLLSFFNILGRIGWASSSDYLGRKRTYLIFFALGFFLYVAAPWAGSVGSVALFAGLFCIILSMYGGGFATIPAYLADIFGTQHVGAIHGRLLTAWATAGVLGPVTVNYLRDYQLDHGVPASDAYNVIMYVLAGLLVLGFICNLLVKPVADKHYMSEAELEVERQLAHEKSLQTTRANNEATLRSESRPVSVLIAWALVAVPIGYGIWSTLEKAWILFH
ncbi:MAG: MFS transporter [Betaproteobacteria bacterium HGW-Betaproteobacteria-22]|nr:MAG: MFS transporter [Betaproteobacteria bacterium HGW-Betaproteobacteria-22]